MLTQTQVAHLNDVSEGEIGLAGEFFTSEAIFAEERTGLFHGGWMCIGTRDDAGRPGSIYPVRIACVDLVMVRDKAGTLRVFHNHCSHRGAILADQPRQNCATLVCPYHAWSYTLAGALRKTPHVGGVGVDTAPGIDPAELGLSEVRIGEFCGMVFANLSGTAESFDDFIAPMAERLSGYDFSLLHGAGEAATIVEANWKIVVENFVESYHLPWIHPSMNRYNPMEDHYQILGGGTYIGQGLLGLKFEDEAANVLPRFPNLTPEQLTTGESHFLFPNVLFGVMIELMYAVILCPDGAGRTRERVIVMVNGARAASDPALADARATMLERIVSVNAEDIGIVESVQRGRSSPAFVGGRFSPVHERTSQQLQRAYALRMLAAGGHPAPDIALEWGEVHLPREADQKTDMEVSVR